MATITEMTEVCAPGAPRLVNHPGFRALRLGDVAGFHRYTNDDEVVDLTSADLSGADLRKLDLKRVILRGAYLKEADLRGQDLRAVDLEGCSLRNAKVSGAYFADNLRAEEILMSLQFGTRLRTRRE